MRFGIHIPASVSMIGRVVRAEQLGFDSVYFGDSPIIYSDVFASMALAAQAIKKITIGTGITVPGIRMPHVIAAVPLSHAASSLDIALAALRCGVIDRRPDNVAL